MTGKAPRLFLLPASAGAEQDDQPLATRSDDELMMLARGGLAAAFDALVARHQARALRVAARHLGGSALAPDVVQNTFIEIYRCLSQYQARGRFPSYFYRILLNECRMVHRLGRAKRRLVSFVSEASPPTGEARILAREQERELGEALDKLSDKLRQVVVLRYSAELRYEEIAETLEVPVGTVKRRLFDAMAKLRQLMERT